MEKEILIYEIKNVNKRCKLFMEQYSILHLFCVVLQSEQLKPIDGIALEALNATIKKVGKKKPTLKNRL